MWELICHQTYRFGGLPVDLSPYETFAERQHTEFLPDGVTPGSGILRFEQPAARVRMPADPGSPWQTLGGIRIEVTARVLTRAGHWQTLVAGDGSFKWFLRDYHLIGEFPVAPGKSTLPWSFSGGSHDGLSTAEHAAGFTAYEHRLNEWRTFGFAHDGIDTVQLTVDDEVVARRSGLKAAIPGVGSDGVHVGNTPGSAGLCLEGDIDELKIWRLDPDAMKRAFVARPFDQASAGCWAKYFRRMREVLAANSECAREVAVNVPALFDDLLRAIVQSSTLAREEFAQLQAEYSRLWRAGSLDSPEMAAVFRALCDLLRNAGVSPETASAVRATLDSPCMQLLRKELTAVGIECDQEAVALAGVIAKACGDSPAMFV